MPKNRGITDTVKQVLRREPGLMMSEIQNRISRRIVGHNPGTIRATIASLKNNLSVRVDNDRRYYLTEKGARFTQKPKYGSITTAVRQLLTEQPGLKKGAIARSVSRSLGCRSESVRAALNNLFYDSKEVDVVGEPRHYRYYLTGQSAHE